MYVAQSYTGCPRNVYEERIYSSSLLPINSSNARRSNHAAYFAKFIGELKNTSYLYSTTIRAALHIKKFLYVTC